jgi:hypothetical protein
MDQDDAGIRTLAGERGEAWAVERHMNPFKGIDSCEPIGDDSAWVAA